MIDPQESTLLEVIEREPILDRTLAWAAINSGTANIAGLEAIADSLADAFAALPGEISLVDPAPVEKVGSDGKARQIEAGRHLVLRVRPNASRRVLLTGHMDTVYSADHPFQTCDWIDAETLHGPGTADMKGGLSLMLSGLQAYERSDPALGYDVMINSDEETGSLSSSALITQLAQHKIAAFTYEPALPSGNMARARPGSGNFAAVIRGRSAHAGRNPQEGRNAIVAAADLAQQLYAARRDGLSVNPARIEGGAANNTVPDLAILHFNMRPRTPEDLAAGQALIDSAVANVTSEHDVAIHLSGSFARPPKPIASATDRLFSLVSQAGADLGETIGWEDTGGVCDGNNIAAHGVPVIDTMGACGGAIHSPDEFMMASSLVGRARLTALVMHRLERHGAGL
ncbi:hydrolase [Novosphingobium sp. RD2P27]|uniref:Hydrolase n=1 Tax=Novosphingobium kalidii TaxID=3230299 RepID=A0ABV2D367_9SPHN